MTQAAEAPDLHPLSRDHEMLADSSFAVAPPAVKVALLTGGDDKPYVLGFVQALTSEGVLTDVIGSDELEVPELLRNRRVNFLNLRGDQSSDANLKSKAYRIIHYYLRLLRYTVSAQPNIFHILWNNKFEAFDRTLLILYYKLMGKYVLLTAHNVNIRSRDGTDNWLNRCTLRIQYQLVDHIFVHTRKMKTEMMDVFGVVEDKVSVIPFGINNTVQSTDMASAEAKQMLGIADSDRTLLCYGQIAPYKGLDYLIAALAELLKGDGSYRLIIAGKPKWNQTYWNQIKQQIRDTGVQHRIIERIEHVPDEETELYFKAADVLVLSYTQVFQSGVLFLGYYFGLPAIVTDVGSLKEQVVEGETGLVAKPHDSRELARTIEKFFSSELFRELESRRARIREFANEQYSWSKVAAITTKVYSNLL
jgi:glycosyltransferase involved in cell wall biosynthesis